LTHGKRSVLKRIKYATGNDAPNSSHLNILQRHKTKRYFRPDGLLRPLLGAGIDDERREESWIYLEYHHASQWSASCDEVPQRVNPAISTTKFMFTAL
jgi:hypothetical protein